MQRGTKRRIEIAKRETKTQRSVAFSKRRKGLFKKAAEVCVSSGAIIAVYASAPSENSDAIHSFSSHSSSAYEIARCFLNNQIPFKSNPNPNPNPKFSFWWENPELEQCEDPVQLQSLIDRLGKARDDAIAAFTKKKQNQSVVPIMQNPNFSNRTKEATAVNKRILFDEIPNPAIGLFDEIPNSSAILESLSGAGDQDESYVEISSMRTGAVSTFQEISQIDSLDQMPKLTSNLSSNAIEDELDEDGDEFLIEIEKYCN